jgi:hypothetical protein
MQSVTLLNKTAKKIEIKKNVASCAQETISPVPTRRHLGLCPLKPLAPVLEHLVHKLLVERRLWQELEQAQNGLAKKKKKADKERQTQRIE